MEQLLETLPPAVKIFVKERKPTTSQEAALLADDYVTAHKESRLTISSKRESVVCHKCKKAGHYARECPGEAKSDANTEPDKESTVKVDSKPRLRRDIAKHLTCYHCHKKGHIAMECPDKVLLCQQTAKLQKVALTKQLERAGKVGEHDVTKIVLDTGCSRTLVRRDLVSQEKFIEGAVVPIRCAHGDTVVYPLALVDITLGGCSLQVEAAVSETLPLDALLGTDVPVLKQLIDEATAETVEEGFLVTTRAQSKRRAQEEQLQQEKEKKSGTTPSSLDSESTDKFESWIQDLDDDLFEGGRVKRLLTRGQKRKIRQACWEDKTQTSDASAMDATDIPEPDNKGSEDHIPKHALDISADELRTLQATDTTLDAIREAAGGNRSSVGVGFFKKDRLLYRKWTPPGRSGQDMEVEQLVLPQQCRGTILTLAHSIPLSGHLGKDKTSRRVLQRFYWPTLYKDVATYCKSCPSCQKSARTRKQRVPMVPLPIISEPFSRIAMDIVGPLPRSRSGMRYILVICDYATRYPEAIPLKSFDADHVAEALLTFFSRVGIPSEILTDQGSNFTSQLLMEIYRLLHVHPIRTTPYHPQTDGLVERFNQTLKSMLKKTAVEEGKDWDRLIPYLLFAYREVPQSSTGFSPFEFVFGRPVRGPMDVLKETWEADKKSSESIDSYVLSVREKLDKMAELVEENLKEAQQMQKQWYDQNARQRKFQAGDQVLVLLPSSTSKLLAQWQGPYEVVRQVNKVNYCIRMHDKRKKLKTFHINLLKEWNVPVQSVNLMEEQEIHDEGEIPVWEADTRSTVQQVKFGSQLQPKEKEELQKLLQRYSDIFCDKPGLTTQMEHRIKITAQQTIRLPPYRVPHAYRDAVKSELEEMLANNIIEESKSEWSSPMVIVGKRDGTIRICVDYRKLNVISETDAYPMPRIDELIDKVGGSCYISTLDLTRGYWQIPVAKEDRVKTAFSTPYGLFQFHVMPFGLQGAPATFQRLIDRIIQGVDFAAAYLDDLIVFSSTFDEHLAHLQTVFERLRKAGLTLKAKKCELGAAQCEYQGHVVGNGVVRPQESKIVAIENFARPETKKEVRTFLGLNWLLQEIY